MEKKRSTSAPARRASEGKREVRVVRSTLSRAAKSGPPRPRRAPGGRNYVMETRRDSIRKPFPYAIIFSFVCIVAVAMYVLSLRVTLDDLNSEISAMESQIAQAREEENALEVRLGAKYDLAEIERIAKDEYGMVNRDTLSKKYISVSGEDQVEILTGSNPAETEEDGEQTEQSEEGEAE